MNVTLLDFGLLIKAGKKNDKKNENEKNVPDYFTKYDTENARQRKES